MLPLLSLVVALAAPDPEIEVGARLQLRPEARVNDDFSPSAPDDTWRVRQGARAFVHGFWGPASLRVSLQHVHDWGGAGTSTSAPANRSGLFEGYLDLSGERGQASGFIRVGRQWFGLGSQRLMAYRYWQPGNISIDAVRAEGSVDHVTVGGFGSLLAPPGRFTTEDGEQIRSDGLLFGAMYMVVRAHQAFVIDASIWGWREDPQAATPERERIHRTYGLRLFGEPTPGLLYSAEGYVQSGTVDLRNHFAWAFAASMGYEAPRARAHPGFSAGYEMHSGERCINPSGAGIGCGAPESRDFQRLLGIGHRDRGHMDLVGNRNNRTLSIKTWLRPHTSTRLSLDYHFFQLHEPEGQWMLNDGSPVGSGWRLGNQSLDLGHEVDFNILFRPWEFLSLRPAYGVFIPGEAGRRIAGTAPQHFVYLWLIAELKKRW